MSIKVSLSSIGMEEVYTAPTLKEMCLYKCLKNKDILTKKVEVDEDLDESGKLEWEKFRLKEPIQRELVEAVLEEGKKYLFKLTPKYEPVVAGIRMSQPEHLVKVHVSNTETLKDHQLRWLISGGNVKSLDINGCIMLRRGSLEAINKHGSKLEYLRIGDSFSVLPKPQVFNQSLAILKTPNLKIFIVSLLSDANGVTNYWRCLMQDFISNLEGLQISASGVFENLEFLEPAKTKLTSLLLSECRVRRSADAWATLFKLNKLRSLDLIGSNVDQAFVGEDVVQRLLIAMPGLSRLAVDPGLLKNTIVGSSTRGQVSMTKRLEFLGVVDNDADVLRKAKLLAKDVAYFGTFEGVLRILEFYSKRGSTGYFDPIMKKLLESLSVRSVTPVSVISLLITAVSYTGIAVEVPEPFFSILKKLLTPEVVPKFGDVLLNQCIGVTFSLMERWVMLDDSDNEPGTLSDVIEIMMTLDKSLCLEHYATILPMVLERAEGAFSDILIVEFDGAIIQTLMANVVRFLEKAVNRVTEETNELWGISSLFDIMREFPSFVGRQTRSRDRDDLLEIFSSMIASLRKLCINSGFRRAAFQSRGGVKIVLEWLTEITYGRLGLADQDCLELLELLSSTVRDPELEFPDSKMIASSLENLLTSLHGEWGDWLSPAEDKQSTHCMIMGTVAGLLQFLESDSRFDYKAGGAVKEIMMKLN